MEEEIELLQEIQECVESDYVEGRPRHHLPSAREIEPSEGQSIIFVTNYSTFSDMPTNVVQDIFKTRHILVLDCPLPSEEFNTKTMRRITNVNTKREIQGKRSLLMWFGLIQPLIITDQSLRTPEQSTYHRTGTLREFYDASQTPGYVLNALDIPLGHEERYLPPFR